MEYSISAKEWLRTLAMLDLITGIIIGLYGLTQSDIKSAYILRGFFGGFTVHAIVMYGWSFLLVDSGK